MARRASPFTKSVTIRDIARELGVSVATVSHSLRGDGTVSAKLRQRVREAAAALGYQPNRLAQAVRTGSSRIFGLILPDLSNPFYADLAQAVIRAAKQHDHSVLIVATYDLPKAEEEELEFLRSQRVDGILWCRTSTPDATISRPGIPFVVIGARMPLADSVSSDDRQGAELIADHLAAGRHARIGIISRKAVDLSVNERRQHLLDALGESIRPVWDIQASSRLDLGEEVMRALAQRSVTAVVCGNDIIAIAAIRALRQLTVAVPSEIAVIGFDNIPWSQIVSPSLTTVAQPVDALAETAVDLLLRRIKAPGRRISHKELPVTLCVRESSEGRPRAGV
jgi:LacI family transcriptional regulator